MPSASRPRFVFRGLTYDRDSDPATDGLSARCPDANCELRDQINYYRQREGTQFISTSKSFLTAMYYATDRGASQEGKVVKIDLDRARSLHVCDVSDQHCATAQGLEVGDADFNFAVRHCEVLIEGRVPVEAIVRIYKVNGGGSNMTLEQFENTLPTELLRKIATNIYGIQEFFMDHPGAPRARCHLAFACPLLQAHEPRRSAAAPAGCEMCLKCVRAGADQAVALAAPAPTTPERRGRPTGLGLSPPALPAPPPPPVPRQSRTFYRTPTGKKYHVDRGCYGLQKARSVAAVGGMPGDLDACSLCCK
mmetsp:Transcript_23445/g.65659  ORF Transcript_23445/g.65659 Transcript_23445/m.65659 type:complete len:307 (-) Transcript_23445:209-1129(-)